MGIQADYEGTKNANESSKATKYCTTAKMIHELLPNMIKVIKILQGHKVTPKKQRMQKKMQKQQSTAHNSKNDT